MNIDRNIRESFSEITPLTDNETIIRNVLERANNMKESRKPRLHKGAVAAIAAAAVLITATVSVGAATDWDFNLGFGEAIKSIGTKYKNDAGITDAEPGVQTKTSSWDGYDKQFDFLSAGKELDLWYDFDGYKLNFKGVCADEYAAYLLVDIVFDEDFDYAPKEGWTDWELCAVIDAVSENHPELGGVCTMGEGIISQEGNIVHCYNVAMLFSDETWEGNTMTIDIGEGPRRYLPGVSEQDDSAWKDKEVLDCGLHIEIPMDFDLCESRVYTFDEQIDLSAVEHNREWYGEGRTGTLKSFRVSPLTWSIEFDADTSFFEKGDAYELDLEINLRDRTLTADDLLNGYGTMYNSIFTKPIDPDDIVSITVCGQTFPVG